MHLLIVVVAFLSSSVAARVPTVSRRRAVETPFTMIGDASALANTARPEDRFGPEDKLIPCNGGLVLIDLDSATSFLDHPPSITLQKCGTSSAVRSVQQWTWNNTAPGNHIYLSNPPPYFFPETCVDILDKSSDSGGVNATIYPWICRPMTSEHSNQWFEVDSFSKRIYSNSLKAGGETCWSAGRPSEVANQDTMITTEVCDLNAQQHFIFNGTGDSTIRHELSGLCVDAGTIGQRILYDGSQWVSSSIKALPCPDPGNPPLLPRDFVAAYTVGLTKVGGAASGNDRLIVIGGDDGSNNMYWSDDCGSTFSCYDGEQPWSAYGRSFSPIVQLPILGSPLIMGGGIDNDPDAPNNGLSSSLYYTYDGGNDTWRQTWDELPVSGVWPGRLAVDRTDVYLFGNESNNYAVWHIGDKNYTYTGWKILKGASAFDALGRIVYIKDGQTGTNIVGQGGCWFSTDFDAGSLWVENTGFVYSSSAFSTARNAAGPWSQWLDAPWDSRASAAVVASEEGTAVFFGGGMTFENGLPSGETFGDVWTVDATVCLLSADGQVCNGHGVGHTDVLRCVCEVAWNGDDRCSTCTPGYSGVACNQNPSASASPSPQPYKSPGLSDGAAAAIALSVIGLAAGAGIYVYAQYFGGGPVLRSISSTIYTAAGKQLAKLGGGGGGERVSLLAPKGAAVSASAAQARFTSV